MKRDNDKRISQPVVDRLRSLLESIEHPRVDARLLAGNELAMWKRTVTDFASMAGEALTVLERCGLRGKAEGFAPFPDCDDLERLESANTKAGIFDGNRPEPEKQVAVKPAKIVKCGCEHKGPCCNASMSGFRCCLPVGHEGTHKACAGPGNHNIMEWEDDPAPKTVKPKAGKKPTKRAKCGCKHRGERCLASRSGFQCWLPVGHKGRHKACSTTAHNLLIWDDLVPNVVKSRTRAKAKRKVKKCGHKNPTSRFRCTLPAGHTGGHAHRTGGKTVSLWVNE